MAQHRQRGGHARRPGSPTSQGERIVEMLDHIEKRVELMREHAASMEHEKEALVSMLRTIQRNEELAVLTQGEQEEIGITVDRLLGRALSVEVAVNTPRNELQEAALQRVNLCIDSLLVRSRQDPVNARATCEQYLSACASEGRGPMDHGFQASVIECTADDQKKTRKRLETILNTLAHVAAQPS
uniref:Putative bag family molecular chaperone regulator 2 n=1 Tax=Ixodes ricinus TaxID=34613 RepID=A0A0K8RAP9_IXORI